MEVGPWRLEHGGWRGILRIKGKGGRRKKDVREKISSLSKQKTEKRASHATTAVSASRQKERFSSTIGYTKE